MKSLIIEGMTPITYKEENAVEKHSKEITDNGLKILEEVILTNSIAMFVIEYSTGPSAWSFYPKSELSEYISGKREGESLHEFTQRCIDTLLEDHNWIDDDVAFLIRKRGRDKKQNGNGMVDMRVENGYFLYRTAPWPCGEEFMMLPAGVDEDGKNIFKAEKVYEEVPWYERKRWKRLENAPGSPKGYKWYSNGVSRFGGNYKIMLVKEKK